MNASEAAGRAAGGRVGEAQRFASRAGTAAWRACEYRDQYEAALTDVRYETAGATGQDPARSLRWLLDRLDAWDRPDEG